MPPLDDAEWNRWRGEISAKLDGINKKADVLFQKLDQHVQEDDTRFQKAAESRRVIQDDVKGLTIRLSMIVGGIVVLGAVIQLLGPKLMESWM